MQFIDLHRQFDQIESEIRKGMDALLAHKQFIMGPEVHELEEQLAHYTGRKHVLGCSNGTDALVIPLMAIGLSKEDAVFVPSFTFFATAECVTLTGGTPVFVDSDPDTFNISTTALEAAIEKTIAEGKLKPRGIIPVDLFGLSADYEEIDRIAKKYDLFVLEDAAQGFGGTDQGKRAGAHGDVAATSFFPAKPLGCYGDGGAIFTDDDELAALMSSIRVHGQGTDRYDNVRIGINGRLDAMQAVVLLAKLKVFDEELVKRNEVAAEYTRQLQDVFKTPVVPEGKMSSWAQYTIQAKDRAQRDHIVGYLKEKGIPTMIYYPTPIHLSTAYKELGYQRGDLPVAEKLSGVVLSVPMHPYLTKEETTLICDTLKEAVKQ